MGVQDAAHILGRDQRRQRGRPGPARSRRCPRAVPARYIAGRAPDRCRPRSSRRRPCCRVATRQRSGSGPGFRPALRARAGASSEPVASSSVTPKRDASVRCTENSPSRMTFGPPFTAAALGDDGEVRHQLAAAPQVAGRHDAAELAPRIAPGCRSPLRSARRRDGGAARPARVPGSSALAMTLRCSAAPRPLTLFSRSAWAAASSSARLVMPSSRWIVLTCSGRSPGIDSISRTPSGTSARMRSSEGCVPVRCSLVTMSAMASPIPGMSRSRSSSTTRASGSVSAAIRSAARRKARER